jgi:hypothetical protein
LRDLNACYKKLEDKGQVKAMVHIEDSSPIKSVSCLLVRHVGYLEFKLRKKPAVFVPRALVAKMI